MPCQGDGEQLTPLVAHDMLFQRRQTAADTLEDIVEIVRDAAVNLPHGLHLPSLDQLGRAVLNPPLQVDLRRREASLGSLALSNVDQHVDRADQFAAVRVQGCRIRGEKDAAAVGAQGNSFKPTNGTVLLQRYSHRALVMGQRRTVRPVELPEAAPLTLVAKSFSGGLANRSGA